MAKHKTLNTAGLIVLKDKKLLLAFSANKKAWYLPGGKLNPEETAAQGLIREVFEELQLRLNPQQLTYYGHITAPAFGEADLTMEQACFSYVLHETPKPSNEILAVKYFDLESYRLEKDQVPGVIILFERLRADALL